MRMTLAQFIEAGGVPQDEAFYLYHPQVFQGMFDCVKSAAYLNRNVSCNLIERVRRKACYDLGLGSIPIQQPPKETALLFWGQFDGAIRLESVPSLFRRLGKMPGQGYHIIIGMSDDTFGDAEAALIPENVARVFVMNCDTQHEKVRSYPLGRDYMGKDHFDLQPKVDKAQTAYCNFSPTTHPDRRRTLELLEDRPFVNTVRIDGYGHYKGYPMSNREFLEQLNDHVFCICPRGAGYDTYRLWDSLHLGVIPIVVREAVFHDSLADLPVLFLEHVEQFGDLSEDVLEKTRKEMLTREYDFSTLTASFWRRRFIDGLPH